MYRIELKNKVSAVCAEPHYTMRVHEEILNFCYGVATTTSKETAHHAQEHMGQMFDIFEVPDEQVVAKIIEKIAALTPEPTPRAREPELEIFDAVTEETLEITDSPEDMPVGHVVSTTEDSGRVALKSIKKPGRRH